jgi:hypothetical protein
MRMAKVKSRAGLVGRLKHNTREYHAPNVDESRSGQNWSDGGSVSAVMARYQQLLPGKVRANAVHAIELVMTASPDSVKDWKKYLADCDKWAKDLFGAGNVLHVAHHLDETTPHTQILVMPLKDGKLNAKHYIGGSRDRMTELQNDFHEKVGRTHGLERGNSRSETRSRHTPHTLEARAALLENREKRMDEWDEKQEERLRKFESELSDKEHAELFGDGEYAADEALQLLQEYRHQKMLEHEARIEAQEKKLDDFAKLSGVDVRDMKNRLDNWERQTPESLRGLAKVIEGKGLRTVGEYQRQQEQSRTQQQGIKR